MEVFKHSVVMLYIVPIYSIGQESGADPGFLKGGGVQARIQDFSQAPPLGHCPRDVIHIPRGGRGNYPCHTHTHPGSATGVHLRSTSKKRGGGPTLGPMLKSLHRGPKGGGVRTPWTPPLDPPLGVYTGGPKGALPPPPPKLTPAGLN